MKLLEDKIVENLIDPGSGDDFLDTTPKILPMKEVNDKLDVTKIKNVCSVKGNEKTVNIFGENICKRHI